MIPQDLAAMVLDFFGGDQQRADLWWRVMNPVLDYETPLKWLANGREVELREKIEGKAG